MRTLVVSDLHLGSPGRIQGADDLFISLLKHDWDKIIFLGDLFELWEASYRDIENQHREVLSEVFGLKCETIYVPGNHDDAFTGLKDMNGLKVKWPTYSFEDTGNIITLAHGDQYDTFSRPTSRLASLIAAAADRISVWLLGKGASVQRAFRKSLAKMGSKEQYARPIAEKAVEDLTGDIIIVGHTHLPEGPTLINNTIYFNTGDFGPDHLTWIEIEDGDPILHCERMFLTPSE